MHDTIPHPASLDAVIPYIADHSTDRNGDSDGDSDGDSNGDSNGCDAVYGLYGNELGAITLHYITV